MPGSGGGRWWHGFIIDAKDDKAAAWYVSYGAMALADAKRTLVLPLATIESLLKEVQKLAT